MLRYTLNVPFDAPPKYAYEWCTDFRDDDPTIVGGPFTRHILRRRKNDFVWIQRYLKDGKEKDAVRIVTLMPPDAWINDAINEEKESFFEYRITPVGKSKSRLTIRAKINYKSIAPEDPSVLKRNLNADWQKYKAALEGDYASGKKATA